MSSFTQSELHTATLLRKNGNVARAPEESISELESILKNVQDENISLDQIQINYIKGHLLLQHCEELLQFVEQEINEINPEFLKID